MENNETLVTPASNGEMQDSSVDMQTPAQDTDYKKLAYANYGKLRKAEETIAQLTNTVQSLQANSYRNDYDGYEPDQINTIEKIAERKAQEIVQRNLQNQSVAIQQQKEEEHFLIHNPDAYEFMDELRNFKKMAPSRSYSAIWKSMYAQETPSFQSSPQPRSFQENVSSGNPNPPKRSINDMSKEEIDQTLDEEFNKMMGRG